MFDIGQPILGIPKGTVPPPKSIYLSAFTQLTASGPEDAIAEIRVYRPSCTPYVHRRRLKYSQNERHITDYRPRYATGGVLGPHKRFWWQMA